MFQSLRGFGVGWSCWSSAMVRPDLKVSIPERVWGGLERRYPFLVLQLCEFQSLRGFGVGWSVFPSTPTVPGFSVSIPERVWGGLEPLRKRPV